MLIIKLMRFATQYIFIDCHIYKVFLTAYIDIVKVKVAQLCPTVCDPMDCIVDGILQARILEWVGQPFSSPGNLPNPGIEPRSPALQADSLPAEPQGKPKNTGVDSFFLLQEIFPTQGSNPDFPHCRWILYQLSYQRRREGETQQSLFAKIHAYVSLSQPGPTNLFFHLHVYCLTAL